MLHDVINLSLSLWIKFWFSWILFRSLGCTIHFVQLLPQKFVVVIVHDVTTIWVCSIKVDLLLWLPWRGMTLHHCSSVWCSLSSRSLQALELISRTIAVDRRCQLFLLLISSEAFGQICLATSAVLQLFVRLEFHRATWTCCLSWSKAPFETTTFSSSARSFKLISSSSGIRKLIFASYGSVQI